MPKFPSSDEYAIGPHGGLRAGELRAGQPWPPVADFSPPTDFEISPLEMVIIRLRAALANTMNEIASLEGKLSPLMVVGVDDEPKVNHAPTPTFSKLGTTLNDVVMTLENNVVARLRHLYRDLEV